MPRYVLDVTDYSGYKVKELDIIGLMAYYAKEIDHVEYADFDEWKADMLRSGLLTEKKGETL